MVHWLCVLLTSPMTHYSIIVLLFLYVNAITRTKEGQETVLEILEGC